MSEVRVEKLVKDLVFVARLFPLQVGQVITIEGRVTGYRFNIDFVPEPHNFNAQKGHSDSLLHVRWGPDNEIVRNSYFDNQWHLHEKTQNLFPKNTPYPPLLQYGTFRYDIYVDKSCFIISVNKKPFCTYDHKKSISLIKQILITGNVKIYGISQNQPQMSPAPWPIQSNQKYFESTIPSHLKPGTAMIFTALPTGSQAGSIVFSLIDWQRINIVRLTAKIGEPDVTLEWNGNSLPNIALTIRTDKLMKVGFAFDNRELLVALNGGTLGSIPYGEELNKLLKKCIGFTCTGLGDEPSDFEVNALAMEFIKFDVECKDFECLTKIDEKSQ